MIFKNGYLSLFCAIFLGLVVIFYSEPCVGDPPRIDCTVASTGVKQGEPIKVEVESDEQLKSLKVFLKQPKCSSNNPLVVQNMMGKECIAIDMKREKGNKYVGHIDTSDLIPGEAVIKAYATDLDKEHATDVLAVQIK
jgi:hypothetical protein